MILKTCYLGETPKNCVRLSVNCLSAKDYLTIDSFNI